MTSYRGGNSKLLQAERAGSRALVPSCKHIHRAMWLAAVTFVLQSACVYAGQQPEVLRIVPASFVRMVASPQAETVPQQGATESPAALAAIQKAVEGVQSSTLQALGKALGMSQAQIGQQAFEDSDKGMEVVNGLNVGEARAVAVKWRPAPQRQDSPADIGPSLYLLSWDGKAWQPSYLTTAKDALTLEVLPSAEGSGTLFAVVIYRGVTAVPYPVVFRFEGHHALLAWDGRSDAASYTGYDYGSIQFEKAAGSDMPVMIAAGRADPGLLIFPVSSDKAGRGFQAATLYVWKNDAYVPLRTEYTENRDYILYRFIAALHLHDFKTAYSLVDPGLFLKSKKPSLSLFRERMQNAWPEFLDDRIFEVPANSQMEREGYDFILRLKGGRIDVYHPDFTAGPDYRLSGLERTESHE